MLEATEKQKKELRRIKYAIWIMLVICAALGAFVYAQSLPPPAHLYDALAKCIAAASTTLETATGTTTNSTKFYGAFWCPHCEAQKTKFGTGAQYLPYVECSLPSGSGQTQICIDHDIVQYPTWVFPDGSRLVGVQTPATLAAKTGCALPTSTPHWWDSL